MQSRQQDYAAGIFEQVSKLKEEKRKEKEAEFARKGQESAPERDRKEQIDKAVKDALKPYGSMAHQLPVLVRSAGLAQALAFVDARGSDLQKRLLDHLADVVIDKGKSERTGAALVTASRKADLTAYMIMTERVLAALIWYKRFAQSVLDVAHGE